MVTNSREYFESIPVLKRKILNSNIYIWHRQSAIITSSKLSDPSGCSVGNPVRHYPPMLTRHDQDEFGFSSKQLSQFKMHDIFHTVELTIQLHTLTRPHYVTFLFSRKINCNGYKSIPSCYSFFMDIKSTQGASDNIRTMRINNYT